MLRKEITNITHLSQYKKELKSMRGVAFTAFAPDTDTSFTIHNKAVLFGKNIKEVICNINRHDDLNWYNFIHASSDSLDVPEDIYVVLYFAKTYFILKYVVREISTQFYGCECENKYKIIYESSELYYIRYFKEMMYSNYYSIRENIKFGEKITTQY